MPFLRDRDRDAVEEMDKPDCDPALLDRTYRQFPLINAVVAGWRHAYLTHLLPYLSTSGPTTLLDVGSGGGDVARSLVRWAGRDGYDLQITAIDPDERAHRFATSRQQYNNLEFRRALSSDLVAEGRRYDLVISNHVLHHLSPTELAGLLRDTEQLCRRAAFHSDIARSPVAYALFSVGTLPFFPGSLIRRDGLTSIRRSYRADELQAAARPQWLVQRERPFRILLTYRADGEPPVGSAGEGTADA
jgi:2-polyprenyl-3-methyl-5-hydroxy-6-metoxy-1,4-benzoquinol methylase